METEQIRILLERQKRANSRWFYGRDSETRTPSRFWQKYPGINWNYWFSANGNGSYYYRVWAIQARLQEELSEQHRALRETRVRNMRDIEELQKSHVLKVEELSRRKLTEDFLEVTSFFQGSNVKTVYNLGGQEDGVPNACQEQAAADSRGSRTCACANTSGLGVAHAGEEGWINILAWYRLVCVAIPPVSRTRREDVVRGRQSSPIPAQASRVSVPVRGCAWVTGKAGEKDQNSGEMGGSSPWTRPSAPECGGAPKAPARDQRPI